MSLDSHSISQELITGPTHRDESTFGFSNHSLKSNCVSCLEPAMVTPENVLSNVPGVLVLLITVCGNFLVIASVCHFKQLHTPTNVLILSLAVADFMVGLFVMPIAWSKESCWAFGTSVCAFLNFFSFHLTCTSIHNVALIAVDRYLALSDPFLYTKYITVKLTVIVALLCWAVSVAYNFTMLYCNGFFTHALKLCPSECPVAVSEIWSGVDFVVAFALPFAIIFVLYIKVFAIAKRHANAIRAANNNWVKTNARKNEQVPKQSERKAAKVLGILVFVFLLCVVPYFVASVLAELIQRQFFDNVLDYTSVILYLNSLFNPIIYALFYPWFQKSMKFILSCRIFAPDSSLMQLK